VAWFTAIVAGVQLMVELVLDNVVPPLLLMVAVKASWSTQPYGGIFVSHAFLLSLQIG